jgi:hypothetical protein
VFALRDVGYVLAGAHKTGTRGVSVRRRACTAALSFGSCVALGMRLGDGGVGVDASDETRIRAVHVGAEPSVFEGSPGSRSQPGTVGYENLQITLHTKP